MSRGINWKFWSRVDKARSTTNRLKIVQRYFLSYVVVLFVPILLSVAIYRESFVLAEQQTRTELETSLSRAAQYVSLRLNEIERLVSLVESNPALRRFQYMTDEEVQDDYFRLIALRNSLFPFSRVNNLVHDYFVFFSMNEYFAAPYYAGRARTFYEERFAPYFETYDQFRQAVVGSFHHGRVQRLMQSTERPGLGYLVSLGMPDEPAASVLVELNSGAIREALEASTRGSGDWIALYAYDGTRIGEIGDAPDASGSQEDRLYLELPIEGRQLLLRAGYSVVTTSTYRRRVTAIVGVSLLLSTVVGLALALLLSRSHSRPLQKLLRHLDTGSSERGGQGSVSARIDQIAEQHSQLRTLILKQRPVLQSAVLGRLIRGEYHSSAAVQENLRMAGVELDGRWFSAVVVSGRVVASLVPMSSSAVSEMEAVRLVVREALEEAASYPIVDISGSAMIAFAASHESTRDDAFRDIHEQFGFVARRLTEQEGLKAVVSVGPLVNELSELASSATSAQLLADHLVSESCVGVYSVREDADTVSSGRYEFPTELENRITVAIRTGATEEAAAHVRNLLESNAAKSTTTSVLMATLGAQVCGMLYRAIAGLPEELQESFANDVELTASRLYGPTLPTTMLVSLTRRVAQAFAGRKKSHNDVLLSEMIECVKSNVDNPNLSLALAADVCGISEAYASQFFKEQSGECFSGYVDRLRMATARTLLAEHGRPVKDVAHAVGYRNVSSFNRAFKRIVGATPGEFRRVS
jgi:AraC-like DNA-binding protein